VPDIIAGVKYQGPEQQHNAAQPIALKMIAQEIEKEGQWYKKKDHSIRI
jgi:hypothetical protein